MRSKKFRTREAIMDVQVSKEVIDNITDVDKAKIAEIMNKNFGDKKTGLDFSKINLVPTAPGLLARGPVDCAGCDAGYGVAVAACTLLGPFGAAACISIATAARDLCRKNNCP